MLIRPGEQDAPSMLEAPVRHTCLRGWEENLLEIPGDRHISDVFRGPMIRGQPGTPIPRERHYVLYLPPQWRKQHIWQASLVLEAAHSPHGAQIRVHNQDLGSRSRLRRKQSCHLILEVEVLGKDAMWSLWQAPVGESQPGHIVPCGCLARPCHLQGRIICLLKNNC